MKKNILEVSNNLSIGGTERTMQIFASSLDKDKYNVFVSGFFSSGVREDILRLLSLEVFLPFGDVERFKRFLLEKNIDILHWYGMPKGNSKEKLKCLEILKFCRERGIVIIETELFSSVDEDLESLIDLRLCISHTSLDKLFYKYPKLRGNSSKYGFLYCPLDISSLKTYRLSSEERKVKRDSLGIGDNMIVLGKICRSHLWKWDDAIIDIAYQLVQKGYPIKVLIRSIPEIKKEKVRKLGLENYFIYQIETVNERELAQDSYQLMDIMVHTSRIGESFGMTLSEGMFFGLPILVNATDFREFTIFERDNSQSEIVQDGMNGYVESSFVEMVKRIEELLENPSLLNTIKKYNQEYASTLFSNLILAKQLEEVFDTLCIPKSMQHDPGKPRISNKQTHFWDLIGINLKALYEKYRYHC